MICNVNHSLKQLRRNKKITQKELSVLIGISERSYREKEKGHAPFNQQEMIRLKNYFKLSFEDFFLIFFSSDFK